MAITDDTNNGFYMPVAPAYGGNNGGFFGGDWAWIILLLLIGGNGWGMGGFGMGGMMPWMMGGMNNFGIDYLYPWMNNSQHISDGFRDQQLNSQIGDLRTDVNRGFGDVQNSLCAGFNGVNQTVQNGFSQAEIAANGRQMANMNQNFALQTGIMQNTRDIIEAQTRNTQSILDKLCALELDGVKGQLAQAQRENVGLQNQLNMATLRESQTAQNAFIAQGFANEVDQLYNRLNNCPVPSTPVYGRTPIFNCNQGGCNCGAN